MSSYFARGPNEEVKSRGRTSQIDQWITLSKLWCELRALYKRLIDTTHSTDFSRAHKVRRLYKDASEMLEIG